MPFVNIEERKIIHQIEKILEDAHLEVKTDYALVEAGMIVDVFATTPKGQSIIIDVKDQYISKSFISSSKQMVSVYKKITGINHVFMVVPKVTESPIPNIVNLEDFRQAFIDQISKRV